MTDFYLAVGFVRNLVRDSLYGITNPTPLNYLDIIYFDTL
ncbi:nucleotidyltransferase family protein [Vibrio ichthyoenteri]